MDLLGGDPIDQAFPDSAEPSQNAVESSPEGDMGSGLVTDTTHVDEVAGTVGEESDSVLGVYRDPNEAGYYSNDPVIYEDIDVSASDVVRNSVVGGTKPEYGILTTITSGEIFAGGRKITVYGDGKEAHSWSISTYGKTGEQEPVHGWDKYGWMPERNIDVSTASRLEVTRRAIDYFERNRK